MLTTGNNEYAIYRAADVLYRYLAERGVYNSVTEVALALTRTINELKDKPEGYFIGSAGWHAIRLLEKDTEGIDESNVYIGLNVLEYYPGELYHLVHDGRKEWEYFETPDIPEEDR